MVTLSTETRTSGLLEAFFLVVSKLPRVGRVGKLALQIIKHQGNTMYCTFHDIDPDGDQANS